MVIPFTNIQIGRNVVNKNTNRPSQADLTKKIHLTQLMRVKEDIDKWRAAVNRAESKLTPDRTDLIRIFNDITLDAHLTSLMETNRRGVLSSGFYIESAGGEINEELTEKFRKAWFRNFVEQCVDAKFYGYSLIQFGNIINDVFATSEGILREYVVPEHRAVKKNMRITQTDLIYFDEKPYDAWTLFVHNAGDLGLLAKAAPLIIWKKNAMGAWSEAAEIFGMPVRMGKTDINNPNARLNMENMLREMGSAAYGVFDTDDDIQYVEISKADFYRVYLELVNLNNAELSKLFLGQTMTSDDGSSRSQAEVHERVKDDYISADKRRIGDIINDVLIPKMQFHGLLPSDARFKWDDELKVTIDTKFKWTMDAINSKKYIVPADWIDQTFGIPVEDAPEPEPLDLGGGLPGLPGGPGGKPPKPEKVKSVMPDVAELYAAAGDHSH